MNRKNRCAAAAAAAAASAAAAAVAGAATASSMNDPYRSHLCDISIVTWAQPHLWDTIFFRFACVFASIDDWIFP